MFKGTAKWRKGKSEHADPTWVASIILLSVFQWHGATVQHVFERNAISNSMSARVFYLAGVF
jgi:hypothetical protein